MNTQVEVLTKVVICDKRVHTKKRAKIMVGGSCGGGAHPGGVS